MDTKQNKRASFFYRIGEVCVVPLRFVLNNIIGRILTVLVPGEYGNAKTVSAEIGKRILLALLLLLLIVPVLVTAVLWVIFRLIGDVCLGSQNFLMFKGHYKGPKTNRFATWNVASFLPPCTLVDGVAYDQDRTQQIGEQLKEFHFVCCQELGGAEARFLSKHLANDFAEFYTYLGKSHAPFLESGLFFASKEPVVSVHWYPYTVKGVQVTINRSFAVFELSSYYVVTTHPDSASDAAGEAVRHDEIHQLLQTLEQFQDKPIIFCADLNVDRYNNETGYQLLITQFPDVIGKQYLDCSECTDLIDHPYCPNADNGSTSCITDTDLLAHNRFNKKTPVQCSSIDFFSSNKLQVKLVGSEYFYWLTDHHLMKGEIS